MGEKNDNNMFCGLGPVPKGKVRGTPEYCLQNRQVRYYGKVAIDPKILTTVTGKTLNLTKEKIKLKKIGDDAKFLIKEVKNIKVILDDRRSSPSEIKRAKKKMDALLLKRDKLVNRLKAQKKIVVTIEKEEEKLKKLEKKKKK